MFTIRLGLFHIRIKALKILNTQFANFGGDVTISEVHDLCNWIKYHSILYLPGTILKRADSRDN